MKFKVVKSKGKDKVIEAKNLDDAERKANEKHKSWTEIIDLRYAKA